MIKHFTLIDRARRNKLPPLARKIAKAEGITEKLLAWRICRGEIVIPVNLSNEVKRPCAIGKGLRVKVNANIGTSDEKQNVSAELQKLKTAIKYGTDTVMDLSTGGDLIKMLKSIIDNSTVPVGTVPVYMAALLAEKSAGSYLKIDKSHIFDSLIAQAKLGVDFFTVHSGVTRASLALAQKYPRLLDIVSRGGAMLFSWMKRNNAENPLYEYFDEVLAIARKYDITLSLGDGLRPGSILDATDRLQLHELRILGRLAQRALRKGVQVIIEGPGHVPLNQIQKNIALQKKLCRNAPFYVLGPLVTDIAAGYDHINGAIGGALAAYHGADFLCYLTPAEHLRHPSNEDVKEGVIASRIAAHAADIARGNPAAIRQDKKMSCARKKRDWQEQIRLSIDPEKAGKLRKSSLPRLNDVCTMCGRYCSIKLMEECVR